MTDKEVLLMSIEKQASMIAKDLFGFSGLGVDTLIKIAVKNSADRYAEVLSMFLDKNGDMPDADKIFDAFADVMKQRGGISVAGVKFDENDIHELKETFLTYRKNR